VTLAPIDVSVLIFWGLAALCFLIRFVFALLWVVKPRTRNISKVLEILISLAGLFTLVGTLLVFLKSR